MSSFILKVRMWILRLVAGESMVILNAKVNTPKGKACASIDGGKACFIANSKFVMDSEEDTLISEIWIEEL